MGGGHATAGGVRPRFEPTEGQRLKSISRRAKYQSKRERAMILLAPQTGMSAPEIAELVRTDDSHVRKVIHAFNEEGFSSLDPDYRGGRPPKTTPAERDRIVALARARPDTEGVALTRWSLRKLRPRPIETGVVEELGRETLRQVLRRAGLSHQRTRSWKWSPDPLLADELPKHVLIVGAGGTLLEPSTQPSAKRCSFPGALSATGCDERRVRERYCMVHAAGRRGGPIDVRRIQRDR